MEQIIHCFQCSVLISEFKPRTKVLKNPNQPGDNLNRSLAVFTLCYLLSACSDFQGFNNALHCCVIMRRGWDHNWQLMFLLHVWIFLLCSMLIYLSLPTYKYFLENNEDEQWVLAMTKSFCPWHCVGGAPTSDWLSIGPFLGALSRW